MYIRIRLTTSKLVNMRNLIFLCIISVWALNFANPVSGETETDGPQCPQGWSYHEGSQKCYLQSTVLRSWEDSRSFCQQFGGDLATIRNEDENTFVTNMAKTSPTNYWIGLNDIEQEDNFRWLNEQTQATFTNWKSGEPNNAGNEDCVFITRSYEWQDGKCPVSMASFCERPAGVPQCPQGWSYHDGSRKCYLQSTTKRSRRASRKFCQKVGGDLATIRNEDENTFVTDMAKTSPGNYWIGLNDIKQEGSWRWLNEQTETTFTNWRSGEPNNKGKEDCVYITRGYTWNDSKCRVSTGTFCERPVDAPQCQQGWSYHDGSQKCYLQSTVLRSWEASRSFCQQFGGDLATIRNEDENTFVTNIAKTYPTHYWIGLNDIEQEDSWRWLNETTETTFLNWKSGEPNNAGNEDCVFITTSYEWQDGKCPVSMASFCERPTET